MSSINQSNAKSLQNLGGEQTASQIKAVLQSQKPPTKNTPVPTKYEMHKKEIADGILFGAPVLEVLEAQEGEKRGIKASQWNKIRFKIRDEFFTLSQYIGGVTFGFSMGLLIASIVIVQGYGIADWSWGGNDLFAKLAVFFVVFAIFAFYGKVRSVRKLWCDPDNKNVPPKMKKRDCFYDWDCSLNSKTYVPNTCKPQQPGFRLVRRFRKLGAPIALAIAAVCIAVAFTSNQNFPRGLDLVIPIMTGMGSGIFYGYVMS